MFEKKNYPTKIFAINFNNKTPRTTHVKNYFVLNCILFLVGYRYVVW